MKPIYLRRPYEDGYIEVTYRNHSSCQYLIFVPDPRKLKHHKPKFWCRECGFGAVDGLYGIYPAARPKRELRHKIIVEMLMEAARRYDARYARFGELGNAQMPPNPELQAFHEALSGAFERFR